ncbi:LysR family transcriptional regulator [Ensifer sp. YR511]|uniref:LysR family transcriptional regulator n=1 Tax=Ensifer sp. YR511 TaxID=1855294 RepID=UPI000880626A|nr:LysR family transcriptional regulator [Ensifer sp. YR511]SDO04475.1 LysR family transcriptional regulator, glycine cleavage system transcriptional activator [Ensifer sp. YR511]
MHPAPLNALYAFTLAAEHQSFSVAAQVQGVTPGAISRQIRTLEEYLGCSLFERGARGVALTREGQEAFQITRKSFDQLQDLKFIVKRQIGRTITIHCSLLFMRYWLMPHMQNVIDQLPGIDLAYSVARPDLDILNSDSCFIRIGDGRWPGLRSDYLMPGDLIMVASPRVANQLAQSAEADTLRSQVLIRSQHSGHLPDPWDWWFSNVWKRSPADFTFLNISAEAMAYQAAKDGLGIAIGRAALLQNELRERSLTQLGVRASQNGWGYYLVYADRMNNSPGFRKLKRILVGHGGAWDA